MVSLFSFHMFLGELEHCFSVFCSEKLSFFFFGLIICTGGFVVFVGWGHHFVCKRKYHLIIPAKENWNEPLDEDFAEFESHKLYGLIHCNGYGHLICINGLKSNSKFFTADDSMEFWDRLCTVLKARFIFL